MIRHTVVYKLKQTRNSPEEKEFLHAAKKLASIPGVQHFESLKQISKKNNFDFGLSMEFANQKLYNEYSNHPDHILFIEEYWIKYVDNFLEIDYTPIE